MLKPRKSLPTLKQPIDWDHLLRMVIIMGGTAIALSAIARLIHACL